MYASQIQEVGVIEGVTGFSAYVSSISYMPYAWIAVIIVPLFVLGIIPLFGPMKKAEERVILFLE